MATFQPFMLVGIDFITDEGVLESLWKPHKSKERNFLHRCYTPKKISTFFQNFFFGSRKYFRKNIFTKNFQKKSQILKIEKFWNFENFMTFFDFENFMILLKFLKIFENHQKFSEKKFWTEKKNFVGVENFFRWLVHELLGS